MVLFRLYWPTRLYLGIKDSPSSVHLSLLVSIIFSIGGTPLSAQDSATASRFISVEGLVAASLDSSARIRSAYSTWEAAQLTARTAGVLPEPTLGVTHFLSSVETRVGPQTGGVELSQALPWPGKLAAKRRGAQHRAESAYQNYRLSIQEVSAKVEETYWDWLYLQEAIRLTREYINLAESWEGVVLSKFSTSLTGHPDIIKAQVERFRLQDRLASLESSKVVYLAKFSALLGQSVTESMLPDRPLPAEATGHDAQQLSEMLLTNSPRLLMASAAIKVAESMLSLASKQKIPDFRFALRSITTDENSSLGNIAENGRDALTVSMGISLPIKRRTYRRNEQAATANLKSAHLNADQMERDLLAKLADHHYQLNDTNRKIELYTQAIIPGSQQALEATEKAYISDKVDFLSLVSAQRTLLEDRFTILKLRTDAARHNSHLKSFIGGYSVANATIGE